MFEIMAGQASNALVTFDGDGDGAASVRSMFRMVMKFAGADGAATYMEAQGEYADRVVRTSVGWRLAERRERLYFVR